MESSIICFVTFQIARHNLTAYSNYVQHTNVVCLHSSRTTIMLMFLNFTSLSLTII